MNMRRIEADGSAYLLPEAFYFHGPGVDPGVYFWEFEGWRPPRRGEFYVSGAEPAVYRAHHDMSGSYLVIQPTDKARYVGRWERE